MAIEKILVGEGRENVLLSDGSVVSLAEHVKATDEGGLLTISAELQGTGKDYVVTSAGNVQTTATFIKEMIGGSTDTITSVMMGSGGNLVIDGGVLENMAERTEGTVTVKDVEALKADKESGDKEPGEKESGDTGAQPIEYENHPL